MITNQNKIIKEISLLKNKDARVVQTIAQHPLLFAKHRLADPDDSRPIRIRYFGAFVVKYMRNKDAYRKTNFIFKWVKERPELYDLFIDEDTGGRFFPGERELRRHIKYVLDTNDVDQLDEIYNAISKAIGEQ